MYSILSKSKVLVILLIYPAGTREPTTDEVEKGMKKPLEGDVDDKRFPRGLFWSLPIQGSFASTDTPRAEVLDLPCLEAEK